LLIDLGNDHDVLGEALENTETYTSYVPASDLLSIDQLLEMVWEIYYSFLFLCLSVLRYHHVEMTLHHKVCSLGNDNFIIIFVSFISSWCKY
jgi:protein EFR3